MTKVVIYIPVFNNAEWCRAFEPNYGFDFIASDNASTDGSGDILAAKGVAVIRQPKNLGRVGNWEFCLRHFLESGRPWVNLHMAGDDLFPAAPQIVNGLISRHPDARFIATQCEIVQEGRLITQFGGSQREEFVSSREAVRRVALQSNWVGNPLTTFFHREAIAGNIAFGELPWIADLRCYLGIMQRFPVLCSPEIVGRQVIHPNRLHAKMVNTLQARCEEWIVRCEAAGIYARLANASDAEQAKFLRQCQLNWEAKVFNGMLLPATARHQIEQAASYPLSILGKAFRKKLVNRISRIGSRVK